MTVPPFVPDADSPRADRGFGSILRGTSGCGSGAGSSLGTGDNSMSPGATSAASVDPGSAGTRRNRLRDRLAREQRRAPPAVSCCAADRSPAPRFASFTGLEGIEERRGRRRRIVDRDDRGRFRKRPGVRGTRHGTQGVTASPASHVADPAANSTVDSASGRTSARTWAVPTAGNRRPPVRQRSLPTDSNRPTGVRCETAASPTRPASARAIQRMYST